MTRLQRARLSIEDGRPFFNEDKYRLLMNILLDLEAMSYVIETNLDRLEDYLNDYLGELV